MAGYYRQSRADRAKAAAGALVIHVLLGAAFLTGLATDIDQRRADSLKTFDVNEPPPPPIVEPPPEESAAPKGDPGEAGKKAEPTPIVVPPPRIEIPARSPVAVAPVPGVGAAPSAGAATAGTGTGAGGTGTGRGGGGSGGSGTGIGSEARLLGGNRSRLPSQMLRTIPAERGYAHLLLTVAGSGRVIDCGVMHGTGYSAVDRALCGVMMQRSRWSPARDLQGRPITVQVRYTATWSKD